MSIYIICYNYYYTYYFERVTIALFYSVPDEILYN